jgi:hypothetical protein
LANWSDILRHVRRYTGDAFGPERGYASARKLNFGQRMALLKYERKINELDIYGSQTYIPKRGEKAELFRLTGQTGWRKFTKAILKIPSPNAKLSVSIDKRRPKGSRAIVKDIRPRHKSTYYNIPPEAILEAIREAEENGESPSDAIEDVLREYAPDAKFFMIKTGNYYAWGMSLGADGQRGKIGKRVYEMHNQYGGDKFNIDDPNSGYFENWFNGITAYTSPTDAFPIISAGIKRRAKYLQEHRKHLAATSARDNYREFKDGSIGHYKAGRFQGTTEMIYYDSDNEACRAGWNAYIDGKIREDNPYNYQKERIDYTRWFRCFNRAEEAILMGQTIQRK